MRNLFYLVFTLLFVSCSNRQEQESAETKTTSSESKLLTLSDIDCNLTFEKIDIWNQGENDPDQCAVTVNTTNGDTMLIDKFECGSDDPKELFVNILDNPKYKSVLDTSYYPKGYGELMKKYCAVGLSDRNTINYNTYYIFKDSSRIHVVKEEWSIGSELYSNFADNSLNIPATEMHWETINLTPKIASEENKIVLGNCVICGKESFFYKWQGTKDKLVRGHYIEVSGQESSDIVCGLQCDLKFRKKLLNDNGYENNSNQAVCKLCKGTGIEKNTAQHILGSESGRVCPMCNGKGR